jgi:hypothetical protein
MKSSLSKLATHMTAIAIQQELLQYAEDERNSLATQLAQEKRASGSTRQEKTELVRRMETLSLKASCITVFATVNTHCFLTLLIVHSPAYTCTPAGRGHQRHGWLCPLHKSRAPRHVQRRTPRVANGFRRADGRRLQG